MISAMALMGCGDEDVRPQGVNQNEAVESLDTSENDSSDDGSLFTTIYCKLSTLDGNTSTYSTNFTYDTTTVNYPSALHIERSTIAHRFNREHWARGLGRYRLINISIELPTATSKGVYKPDVTAMYFDYGHSQHFVDPHPVPEMNNNLSFSTLRPGEFYFGERTGPYEFAGYLEFSANNSLSGAPYGGKNGTVGGWYYKGEYGFINLCASKRIVEDAR